MKTLLLHLLRKFKILKYFNFTVKIGEVKIPLLGGLGFGNIDGSEKWMSDILKLLLKENHGLFLDVGVNIGQTLIKLRSIDKNIDYMGLEPNPNCVFYVEKLIETNKFINTSIIPVGVSDANQLVSMFLYSFDSSDSSASIIADFRGEDSVTLKKSIIVINNDLLNIEKRVSIIKIDVEGAELMVIKGLKEIIERDRPFMLVEILPVYDPKNLSRLERQNTLIGLMQKLNYTLYRLLKYPDDSLKDLERLTDIPIHSKLSHCDYLFVPSEKTSIISLFNAHSRKDSR